MRPSRVCLPALALVLLWSQAASAHFLWLLTESDGNSGIVKLYFGEGPEPDDPDLLDRVQSAKVWTLEGFRREARPVSLTKGEDALEAKLSPSQRTATVILNHTYGVISRGDVAFLLKYYGKVYPSPLPGGWQAVNDAERLPLEITPSLDGSMTRLTVTWNGDPVEGASVTIHGPGLKEQVEGTTDAKGVFRAELPEAGVYAIRARHIQKEAGEHDGKKYAEVRHYSTLTLRSAPARLSPAAHKFPELPKGTTSFGGAIAGNALYVYGGNYGSAHEYSKEDQSGDFWKLDLQNPTRWEQLAGGPKLQGLALVADGAALYRIGGFTAMNEEGAEQDLRSQPSVARFDLGTGEWKDIAPLPEGRSSHDAAVLDGAIYVVGGWNLQGASRESKWHETALKLDLSAETPEWKPIASPPFKRRALAVAAWQGKLYAIGGMQDEGGITTRVAVFDPAKDAWTEGPSLLGAGMDGFGSSAFACGDDLYVTTISGSIQRLSGKGTEWEFVGQLNQPRFFHRIVPWQDKQLVVVGGGSMSVGKITELELLPVADLTVKTTAKP